MLPREIDIDLKDSVDLFWSKIETHSDLFQVTHQYISIYVLINIHCVHLLFLTCTNMLVCCVSCFYAFIYRAGPVWAVREMERVLDLSQHLQSKESGSKQRVQRYICTLISHIFIIIMFIYIYIYII